MPTDASRMRITALGGPTLLLEVGGLRLLTDPTFDPVGSNYSYGPLTLHKLGAAALTPAQVGAVDAVLLSHEQHADNLDATGREVALAAKIVLTTPDSAARLGHPAVGLAPWQRHVLPGELPIEVTAVPAQHGPDGTAEMTGAVTGFVLSWPGQTHGAVYISGDTVRFAGTEEIAARCRVGTAILHLGRVQLPPAGDAEFSLSATEAVKLAAALEPRTMIPTHYEGWAHFTEGRQAAEATLDAAGSEAWETLWLEPGTPVNVRT